VHYSGGGSSSSSDLTNGFKYANLAANINITNVSPKTDRIFPLFTNNGSGVGILSKNFTVTNNINVINELNTNDNILLSIQQSYENFVIDETNINGLSHTNGSDLPVEEYKKLPVEINNNVSVQGVYDTICLNEASANLLIDNSLYALKGTLSSTNISNFFLGVNTFNGYFFGDIVAGAPAANIFKSENDDFNMNGIVDLKVTLAEDSISTLTFNMFYVLDENSSTEDFNFTDDALYNLNFGAGVNFNKTILKENISSITYYNSFRFNDNSKISLNSPNTNTILDIVNIATSSTVLFSGESYCYSSNTISENPNPGVYKFVTPAGIVVDKTLPVHVANLPIEINLSLLIHFYSELKNDYRNYLNVIKDSGSLHG
jgi:hypothetical protein